MENEIKLLKNNDKRADSDLEWIQDFYMFLQGEVPETISLRRNSIVKLSKQKAFTIIWYLQEHFSVFPDTIEQCSQCGELYDSESEGIYWGTKGKHYCGGCCDVVPYNYDRGRR